MRVNLVYSVGFLDYLICLLQQEVKNLEGEKALQGWTQIQLMTISDSQLKSYSEGAGWTKGWSQGESQGTSSGKSEQGGASLGANIGVTVLGTGGKVGTNASGNYGYSKSESQNTSESKSENAGANKSKSETTSTSGSRNVVVWPQYNDNGKLEHVYMFILTGDYQNISAEFRRD